MTTLFVVVVDDGSLAIRGAIDILSAAYDCRSVASLREATAARAGLDGPVDTVLVIDPFLVGGDFSSELSEVARLMPVLAISADARMQRVRQALQSGVRGYVCKDINAPTLLAAVQALAAGGIYLDLSTADILLNGWEDSAREDSPLRLLDLTPREKDVLRMIAQGLTHKQIGTRLSLSKATVDTYVHRIRQKVGAVNKAGLTRVAMDMGLLHAAV